MVGGGKKLESGVVSPLLGFTPSAPLPTLPDYVIKAWLTALQGVIPGRRTRRLSNLRMELAYGACARGLLSWPRP